jgi:branched-chain amino acid transport system ATP-binding protein
MSLLSITDLSAGYGKLHVLHAVSLDVQGGQFIGLIGPNGSGKSTLIKSVFGLTDIFAGDIRFDGARLVGLPTETISQHGLAYVPQTRNVFTSLTVRENLQLARSMRQSGENDAARDLREACELFPILDERQSQRAARLSGGERQMLAIAIAWLAGPRLMLLDEPSAGLSPLMVTEVFRMLRQVCERGVTLVVVEQNARSLLRFCDYGYVLREGQIVFQGTAAAILSDEETAKSYLGIGARGRGNAAHTSDRELP